MKTTVIAYRWMHKHCYRLLLIKMASKRGKDKVRLTVKYNPAWFKQAAHDSERAVVEEALREDYVREQAEAEAGFKRVLFARSWLDGVKWTN